MNLTKARKIVYLVNPISGTRAKSTLQEVITRENQSRGASFEIVFTNAEGNYEFLVQQIREEGVTDVVVCGGDGSVNAVAAALIGVDVNVGIVPMGSGNGLALSAKIPTNTPGALEIVFNGKPSFIDGFFINDQFSCMLCGIGFDARVAHDFSKGKRRGLQAYVKTALKSFFSAKPYSFEIYSRGRSLSFDAYFISVANSNQFGNNFTIAPAASLSDGLLDIVIVKKMSKLLLPFSVIRQVSGINPIQELDSDMNGKNIVYFQSSALTITNHEDAPFHIDGDPKPTSRIFEIRVIPRAIRLIQPA